MEYKHFSHPHGLIPNIISQGSLLSCSGCKSQAIGSVYACWTCKFFLHAQCFHATRSMTHPSHSPHPLTLAPFPTYPSNSFFCNSCSLMGSGFSYSCSNCEFDLHVHCAYLSKTTTHEPYPSNPNLTYPIPTQSIPLHNLSLGHTHHNYGSTPVLNGQIDGAGPIDSRPHGENIQPKGYKQAKALTGKHLAVLKKLPPEVRKHVHVLRELQSQHDELGLKFVGEGEALEDKYQKLYQPLYTKRCEIVNDVPVFWLTAMKNNEVLADLISERDEGALTSLKDIKWYKITSPKGFKLVFFFDTNPYFKKCILTKTYHVIDGDEPVLEKVIGTDIDWCVGKCLSHKVLKKKPKKGSKITQSEQCESFFNFFSPPQVPEDDEDYDVGLIIRDKIIPHAVSWFTGEAVQDDEDDDEDEDEDEDDEGSS